jgi:GNAT superfamily N-acetyltransferase
MTRMPAIRPAQIDDAHNIARVHVDTWRTTYVGIVPDEHLASLSYERSQANWIKYLTHPQNGTAFVAEIEGQIVGITSCGPLDEPLADYDSELYVLYVLKSYQGMGLGKLLVKYVVDYLKSKGFHSMVIWVLKDNPACRFYESLGGQLAAEKTIEIGGKQLVDVAYVWSDLGSLIKTYPQGELK